MRGSAGAILLAAGQGRRLGHDKSITAIAGRPVLSYGLGVLLQCGGIEKVVVTVREDVRQEVLAWVQREYGKEYKACSSCGLDHDSEFIGRDECLTDEECKYINLTPEQIEERHNIVKYYKLYQKDRHILGLTTIYE